MAYGTVNAENITSSTGGVISPNITSLRNRIINGAMVIDQRNNGASVTPTTDGTYTVDRWVARLSQSSKYSFQQNAGSVTPPTGFSNYLGITSLSAYTVGASELFSISQKIEGFNTYDLAWGTANAKPITLSFWVYSSLTGTFGGAIENSATAYSYPFTYTISSANTWTQIVLNIAGPTSGTWVGATSGVGMQIYFNLGTGSTLSGTAGTWAAADYRSATGATSVVGTSGATFYITGVQLEVGAQATSFDYRPYGTELALCQRYFYQTTFPDGAVAGRTSVNVSSLDGYIHAYIFSLPVTMRATPSVTVSMSAGSLAILAQSGGTIYPCTNLANGFGCYNNNVFIQFGLRSDWSNCSTGGGQFLFNNGGISTYKVSAEL